MSIAVVAIGDGREEYHLSSALSASEHLPLFDHYISVDDHTHELGYSGAIREGWRRVLDTDAEYVFHLELDFMFLREVPLDRMIRLLDAEPHLAQVALVRQPLNDAERAAGGLTELAMSEGGKHIFGDDDDQWIEHTRCFTTNPCVYPRWVVERGWPDCEQSEGVFGISLLRDRPETRFAYWGGGEKWVEHIGDQRTGTGY